MAGENIRGVRSYIKTKGVPSRKNDINPDSILLLGTASRGELFKPIIPEEGAITEEFGAIPLDTADTSVVRAYQEIKGATQSNTDVRVVRIGNARRAYLDLPEMQTYISGDLAAVQGSEHTSMRLEAIREGDDYNNVRVNIYHSTANAGGTYLPTLFTIGGGPIPEEISFSLDPSPEAAEIGAPGVITSTSGLARAINNDPVLSEHLRAVIYPLEKELDIVIQDDGTGNPLLLYDIGPGKPGIVSSDLTGSWGDKLFYLESVSQLDGVAGTVPGGATSFELDAVPVKSFDPLTPTINKFVRNVTNETIKTVRATDVGGSSAILGCGKYPEWDKSDSPAIRNIDIRRITANGVVINMTEGLTGVGDYTVDPGTAGTTFHTGSGTALPNGFVIGDTYIASYRYTVNYWESKVRSQLVLGDATNYFVSGPEIVFGGGQPYDLDMGYEAQLGYGVQDVRIIDPYNITIEFIGNRTPTIGDTVRLKYLYQPEMPGSQGPAMSFSGGSDGRHMTKSEYKRELIRAYRLISNWPCKAMIPAGAYLDDAMQGYNFETGAPEQQPVGFHVDLIGAVNERSELVRDCVSYISTRPPGGVNVTPEVERAWIDRHFVFNTATDTTRPSNIINTINSYRLSCVVGTPITMVPQVGITVANPAFVYAGMKEDTPLTRSMLGMGVPVSFQRQVVNIANLQDVDRLNAMRYTSFVYNVQTQSVVIADAPTLAGARSEFQRQFVVDVTFMSVNVVRDVAQRFIGMPRRTEILTTMRAQMGSALKKLVPNVLADFTIHIVDVPGGNITGKTKVRLMLVTSVEITQIDIVTEIRLQ